MLLFRNKFRLSFSSILQLIFFLNLTSFGETTFVVDQKTGSDANSGTEAEPFKTVNKAAGIAEAGDTILIREGIYRECVHPAHEGKEGKPITYMAKPGDKVCIRGSIVWTPTWKKEDVKDVYSGALETEMFGDWNPYSLPIVVSNNYDTHVKPIRPATRDLIATSGQVFVDGDMYTQVVKMEELRKNKKSWLVPSDGKSIVIHFDESKTPSECLVEITALKCLFYPVEEGFGYIHVKGLTFEHCSNPGPMLQMGMVSTRAGHHWIIENNTIRYAKTLGLDYGSVDGKKWLKPDESIVSHHMTIRNNIISDNGVCGAAANFTHESVFYGNRVENNACLFNEIEKTPEFCIWNEWAGLKLHSNVNCSVTGNLFRGNSMNGALFLDTRWHGDRVNRNVFIDNDRSILIEGDRVCPLLIDNNIVIDSHDEDLRILDSGNVKLLNNLMMNTDASKKSTHVQMVFVRTPGEYFGLLKINIAIQENSILNNIFLGAKAVTANIPYDGKFCGDNIFDFNIIESPAFRYHVQEKHKEDGQKNTALVPDYQPILKKLTDMKIAGIKSPEEWSKFPQLTFEQWKALTASDTKSMEYHSGNFGNVRVNKKDLTLTFDVRDGFLNSVAEPIPFISKDFSAASVNAAHFRAGPFQELKTGPNVFTLWPISLNENEIPYDPNLLNKMNDFFKK
jgi:hypothetical protein